MELTSERCKNSLRETNKFAPENGCLGEDPFLLGPGLFSGVTSKFCIFLSQKVYRFDFCHFLTSSRNLEVLNSRRFLKFHISKVTHSGL